MSTLKSINFRQLFFVVWLVCYLLIILFYFLSVREDGTIDFDDDIKPLLLKTSAVILPQLIIMALFFFSKTKAQIDIIVKKTHFSKLAYGMSLTYIVLFTLLIFLGIKLKVLPGDTLPKVNSMILTIMGLLSIFANGPIAYLFGKKVKRADLTSKQTTP